MTAPSPSRTADPPPSLVGPGVLLGLGLGGFVDGIVFHQLLQWHHMVSQTEEHPPTTLAGLEANVVADGLFHAATWLLVALGLLALWRAVRLGAGTRSWRSLLGWVLVGAGTFNLVEGTIDHHLLQVHRVRPAASNPLLYDLAFLAVGVALVVGGWLLARSDRPYRVAQAPAGRSG